MIPGADYSHHQGDPDWAHLGIRFAWVKSTEGLGFVDPTYQRKRNAARAAGITTGAYHFLRPGGDPLAQAAWWHEHAGPHGPGDLRPAMDLEVEGFTAAWLKAFAAEAARLFGCAPVLYTYESFLQVHAVTLEPLRHLDLWIAAYQPTRPATPGWRQLVWQNTDKGPGGGDGNLADDLAPLMFPTPQPPPAADPGRITVDITPDQLTQLLTQAVAATLRSEGVSGVPQEVAAALRSEGVEARLDAIEQQLAAILSKLGA